VKGLLLQLRERAFTCRDTSSSKATAFVLLEILILFGLVPTSKALLTMETGRWQLRAAVKKTARLLFLLLLLFRSSRFNNLAYCSKTADIKWRNCGILLPG